MEIYAFPENDTDVSYSVDLFISIIKGISDKAQKYRIYLYSPDIYHSTTLSLLFYLYQKQLNENPDIDILIIPRSKIFDKPENLTTLSFRPNEDNGGIKVINKLDCVPCIIFGGTFDHLHNGHKLLLTASALFSTEQVIVGMNENIHSKSYQEFIQPIWKRSAEVLSVLMEINKNIRYIIEAISDGIGPAGTSREAKILMLTEETIRGGEICNQRRRDNNLPPLQIFVLPLLYSNNGTVLCSTSIRNKLASNQ